MRSERNGKRFGPAPLLVFSWGDVGIKGLAISVGMSSASGFGGHDWNGRGGQRYVIDHGSFTFLSYGGGVSWRPNRYIAIGANFLSGFFSGDFTVKTRQGRFSDQMNEEYESEVPRVERVGARDKGTAAADRQRAEVGEFEAPGVRARG